MYCIYRCFNTQNYIYPFQNLSLGFILKIFLKFCKFQPRYSYKIYSYPLHTRVQQVLLDNFKVIAGDPATSLIFPRPPIIAFRRDDNLRISLVHKAEKQGATRIGTYPCQHPRCRTCGHISSETDLLGPKDRLIIKDSFTCLSSGLIYCIFCRRCPAIRDLKIPRRDELGRLPEVNILYGACALEIISLPSSSRRGRHFACADFVNGRCHHW